MRALRHFIIRSAAALTAICVSAPELSAETIESAMAKAYQGNPQLNAQRALVRATDENVPRRSPAIGQELAVTASLGEERGSIIEQFQVPGGIRDFSSCAKLCAIQYGISASQITLQRSSDC